MENLPTNPTKKNALESVAEGNSQIEKTSKLLEGIGSDRSIVAVKLSYSKELTETEYIGLFVKSEGYTHDELTSALARITEKLFPVVNVNGTSCVSVLMQIRYSVTCGISDEEALQQILDSTKMKSTKFVSGKAIMEMAESLEKKQIEPAQAERMQKMIFGDTSVSL